MEVYLDKILLPVTPGKIPVKIPGQNKTLNLINGMEINFIKTAKLTEIIFDALLPETLYPFAQYAAGFQPAKFFLDAIEQLKLTLKPFQLIIFRDKSFSTNLKVSLEDYQILEDQADQGFDVMVKINLKKYEDFATKVIQIEKSEEPVATVEEERPAETAPSADTYTVAAGDSLWAIAQKMLGSGQRYTEIYEANAGALDAKNDASGASKYTIYPGQVLTLPA
jgi:hypothetical protein